MKEDFQQQLRKAGASEFQLVSLSADPERALAALATAREKGVEHLIGYALSLYEDPSWSPRGERPRQLTNAFVETRCATCGGDRFVSYSTRLDTYNGKTTEVEEYAVCPDCSTTDPSFYRWDGSKFKPPSPDMVRARMKR